MSYNIAIASIPYIGYSAPPAAPALLKGHLAKHGFSCKTFEFNIEFKNLYKDPAELGIMIKYWSGIVSLPAEMADNYNQHLIYYAELLKNSNAEWLGISLFSKDSVRFALDFLPILQEKKSSQQKIIVGGFGLDVLILEQLHPYIDCYIQGDGEVALVELLKGNMSYPGINSPGVQISNLDEIGWADYSDYNLDAGYDQWYNNKTLIPITGSKGCVRDCSFCNVNAIWDKFNYRSGESIAKEIIHNYEKTGHEDFYFTDSLINGNLRELMRMMRYLADYRARTGAKISWGGQWIVRKQKGLPKDYYPLIAASGGKNLTIGVETGSDRVRAHMKKGFTNEDLDAEMEQFSRYGISCGFFIIVGYPTETQEDFYETLQMLKRYVKYVADGTLLGVGSGSGYIPDKTTPIWKENIIHLYKPENNTKWKGPSSNHLENVRRKLMFQQVINNLHYPVGNLSYDLLPVIRKSSEIFDPADKHLLDELLPEKSLEIPAEFGPQIHPEDIEVSITVEASAGRSLADVSVWINKKQIFSGPIDGTKTFEYKITDKRKRNIIKISLNNKDSVLSTVESKKQVLVKEIVLNGARLRHDEIYSRGQVNRKPANGLFENGYFRLYFSNPVFEYFIKQKSFFYESKYSSNKELLNKISELFEHFVR